MKQNRKHLAVIAFVVVIGLIIAYWRSERVEAADRNIKIRAATIMQNCMDQVLHYKKEQGIPLSPEDLHATGMIGEPFTGITTTSGMLEAKRTTTNPDMAALVVEMLEQVGISKGDHVACGFSGSFPALNLAVLSACAAMNVDVSYISSVGASTYGANDPSLTFPDMVWKLVEDGFLPVHAVANSMGGEEDCGLDMDDQLVLTIRSRLTSYGIPFLEIPNYEENVLRRMALYESAGSVDCFIGVGGNITTSGIQAKEIGWGVLKPGTLGAITNESGLLERYSAKGIPVIHLLNINKLVVDYNLPFDPAVLSPVGTSPIYYKIRYAKEPAIVTLVLVGGLLIQYERWKRRDDEW